MTAGDMDVKDSAPNTPRGRARVLVVEDSAVMRHELAQALTSAGYAVSVAETGAEAIRLAEALPDIILLDLVLGDISGLNVCKTLRKRKETAEVPIVILTADARPRTIVQAFKSGANDFIQKPFIPEVMVMRVNRIVRERINETEMTARFQALTDAHTALAAARADLAMQQRLSALGMMASGLAHEMNSPLGALLASLQFVLEGRAESADDAKEALQDAIKAGERVAELVRRMRNIAGADDQTRQTVGLRRGIELVASAFPGVTIEIVGDDVQVPAVEAELREALLALLDNASRAAAMSPTPRVRVSVDIDGAFARVTVDDNGRGIDSADLPYVLTPFFTRNRGVKAMGLGLSLVNAAARRHGGRVLIEARGALGGARATLYVPLTEREAESPGSTARLLLNEVIPHDIPKSG
jgi:signal transduction histidine kinase